jgi:hypothetical protein
VFYAESSRHPSFPHYDEFKQEKGKYAYRDEDWCERNSGAPSKLWAGFPYMVVETSGICASEFLMRKESREAHGRKTKGYRPMYTLHEDIEQAIEEVIDPSLL